MLERKFVNRARQLPWWKTSSLTRLCIKSSHSLRMRDSRLLHPRLYHLAKTKYWIADRRTSQRIQWNQELVSLYQVPRSERRPIDKNKLKPYGDEECQTRLAKVPLPEPRTSETKVLRGRPEAKPYTPPEPVRVQEQVEKQLLVQLQGTCIRCSLGEEVETLVNRTAGVLTNSDPLLILAHPRKRWENLLQRGAIWSRWKGIDLRAEANNHLREVSGKHKPSQGRSVFMRVFSIIAMAHIMTSMAAE